VLFNKRRKPGGPPARTLHYGAEPQRPPEYFHIEREMMLKGAEVPRGGRTVRQFAVMINGSVRVVTSGDTVDRATYDALLAANAITPLPGVNPGSAPRGNTNPVEGLGRDEE